MRAREFIRYASSGSVVFPLGEVTDDAHEAAGATEAGWFTQGKPARQCWLCQNGVCIQRVVHGVTVHGRLG